MTDTTRAEWAAKDLLGTYHAVASGALNATSVDRAHRLSKAQRDLRFGYADEDTPEFINATALAYNTIVLRKKTEDEAKAATEKAAAKAAAEAEANGPRTFGITVSGAQAAGKTTLLMLILQGLANAGVLSDSNTLDAFVAPVALLGEVRTQNTSAEETIVIEVRGDDLRDAQDSLANRGNPTAPKAQTLDAEPLPNVQALTIEYTDSEIATFGWREAVATAAVKFVSDSAFDADTDEVVLTVRKKTT